MTDSGQNRRIQRVAVSAGSRPGRNPLHRADAQELGTLLGQDGYDLDYGGGDFGLMGILAKAALAAGSKVKGFIVRAWLEASRSHAVPGVKEEIIENREERKLRMREDTDASIIIGGGIGSWDELIDVMAWQDEQRYLNPGVKRPIIVLDSSGRLYRHLRDMIDEGIDDEFLYKESETLIHWVSTPAEAVAILNELNGMHNAPASGSRHSPVP